MPLATMAQRTGVAVLLIRHLNKQPGGQALYRGGGSIGIIGAVRSGMLVARDPDDETARVLAAIKSNLAAPQPSLQFRLMPGERAARVEWQGESPHSADALLAATTASQEKCGAESDAAHFLRQALAGGPKSAEDLKRDAKAAGLAWRTIERAKNALRIRSEKVSFKDGWCWVLPKPAKVIDMAVFAKAANSGGEQESEIPTKTAEDRQ
jgi:hypothetical protein